jgi:hypothetical protein
VRLTLPAGIGGVLALQVAAAAACGKGAGQQGSGDAGTDSPDGSTADATPTSDAPDSEGGIALSPRSPSKLALRDIVGLSSHPRLGADATSTAERAFEWARLADLGIHRMRTDFTWSSLEPQRGTFVWSDTDALVTEAAGHGVDLLAVLDYGVTWATSATGANDDYPPDHPADFGAFAASVAKRYAAHITDYEIWNEPNNGLRFWQPTLNGDPVAYGALLQATLGDVKTAVPASQVAYAGVVYDDLVPGPQFVDQSLRANPGLAPALSTFGMHAYESYPPSVGPENAAGHEASLSDKIATMSGVLAADHAPAVPIWITEIGWPVTPQDTLAQQARYTVRACVLAALAGADRVFLYTLLDGPNPTSFPPEDAFGLMTYSDFSGDASAPQPKPAFVAVATLMAKVGAYAAQRRLPSQLDDVYVVQLGEPGGKLAWVVWRATEGQPAVSVTVPATGAVTVTRLDGTSSSATATSAGLSLSAAQDPLLVTEN